jgi:hypothetical protein
MRADLTPAARSARDVESFVLLECGAMGARIGRIDHPWINSSSWVLLLGAFALWLAARILIPTADGAVLRGFWLPACPLRTLTGIPCPFCGITTGCAWLAHGHFREAWHSNILSPFLMLGSLVLGAYVFVVRLIAGCALVIQPGAGMRRALWIIAGAAIAASWIINLFRY